ncbi:MAG: ComEA family DNA-binding protein [Eubacteriales bacterium]|nr:ComEA family DNA-binding protein [Eubacteriales bacterium]
MNKNKKRSKLIIIAAGILISAAFYVSSAEGRGLLNGGETVYIGDEQVDAAGESGEKPAAEDRGLASDVPAAPGSADSEQEKPAGITEEEKAELTLLIRAAVRDELIDMCEEGYLEAAVQQADEEAKAEAEKRKGMVNINTADAAELMTLDGIGKKRADDIISYREKSGDFASTEDIMKVSGIKESVYDKIKDKIYAE